MKLKLEFANGEERTVEIEGNADSKKDFDMAIKKFLVMSNPFFISGNEAFKSDMIIKITAE